MQFQRNDKKTFCPACVRGAARKGSAAGKKASAAALHVTPSRKPRTCGEKYRENAEAMRVQGSPPHVRGKVQIPLPICPATGITPACAGKREIFLLYNIGDLDHPRTCGEKSPCHSPLMPFSESPPRMRGKATGWLFTKIETRITPAYAGKRVLPVRNSWMQQDHPRVCGEKTREVGKAGSLEGSPPRMRGKVKQALHACSREGITPACAGKRRICLQRRLSGRDHPRVCGEKFPAVPVRLPVLGSPPRVRGKD